MGGAFQSNLVGQNDAGWKEWHSRYKTMNFSYISCARAVLAVSNDRLQVAELLQHNCIVQNTSMLGKVGGENQWLVWQNLKLVGQPTE